MAVKRLGAGHGEAILVEVGEVNGVEAAADQIPSPERAPFMANDEELWASEERLWTGGADSARALMAKGAVIVFPYPAGILQGDALWSDKTAVQRWRSVEMSDRIVTRKDNIAVLAYRVSAEREGAPIYDALCASTYLNDDGDWLRLSHQQTPV